MDSGPPQGAANDAPRAASASAADPTRSAAGSGAAAVAALSKSDAPGAPAADAAAAAVKRPTLSVKDTAEADVAEDEEGRLTGINQYTISKKLGAGAFGVVMSATTTGANGEDETFAIKVLLPTVPAERAE